MSAFTSVSTGMKTFAHMALHAPTHPHRVGAGGWLVKVEPHCRGHYQCSQEGRPSFCISGSTGVHSRKTKRGKGSYLPVLTRVSLEGEKDFSTY